MRFTLCLCHLVLSPSFESQWVLWVSQPSQSGEEEDCIHGSCQGITWAGFIAGPIFITLCYKTSFGRSAESYAQSNGVTVGWISPLLSIEGGSIAAPDNCILIAIICENWMAIIEYLTSPRYLTLLTMCMKNNNPYVCVCVWDAVPKRAHLCWSWMWICYGMSISSRWKWDKTLTPPQCTRTYMYVHVSVVAMHT